MTPEQYNALSDEDKTFETLRNNHKPNVFEMHQKYLSDNVRSAFNRDYPATQTADLLQILGTK